MKKLVALALVMVFALSLLTACGGGNSNTPSGGDNTPSGNNSTPSGNNNNNTGDDKPDMNLPELTAGSEWPTAYLPKDFPKFNATPITVNGKPGDFAISYTTSTTTDELMEYLNGLKSSGWTLKEIKTGMGTATKGKWKISYSSGEATNAPGTFNHTLVFKYE